MNFLSSVLLTSLHCQSLTNTSSMVQSYRGNDSARECVWVITRSYWWTPVKELLGSENEGLPTLTAVFPCGDAQSMWVVTPSCCLSKQAPSDRDGTARAACPATTVSAVAMELGWARLTQHPDLLQSQQCGYIQWWRGLALPHCIKGKFHTDFAAKWISFPQSRMQCLPPALQSLST